MAVTSRSHARTEPEPAAPVSDDQIAGVLALKVALALAVKVAPGRTPATARELVTQTMGLLTRAEYDEAERILTRHASGG
jgi:hypothetical protein